MGFRTRLKTTAYASAWNRTQVFQHVVSQFGKILNKSRISQIQGKGTPLLLVAHTKF
jgi:hypothetical protein